MAQKMCDRRGSHIINLYSVCTATKIKFPEFSWALLGPKVCPRILWGTLPSSLFALAIGARTFKESFEETFEGSFENPPKDCDRAHPIESGPMVLPWFSGPSRRPCQTRSTYLVIDLCVILIKLEFICCGDQTMISWKT